MKKIILLIILIISSITVYASPMDWCSSSEVITANCSMVTPPINCSVYDYRIYNKTGGITEYNNLTQFNGDIYYINISLSTGDYLIRLCDNTIREFKVITVAEKEEMTWLPIILSLSVMTFGFGLVTFMIKSPDLKSLKSLFLMLFIVNIFFMGMIPVIMTANPFDSTVFHPIAVAYFSVYGIAFIYFIYLKGFSLILNLFKKDKKKDEYED